MDFKRRYTIQYVDFLVYHFNREDPPLLNEVKVRDEEDLMNLVFLYSILIPSQDERLISSKIPIGEG